MKYLILCIWIIGTVYRTYGFITLSPPSTTVSNKPLFRNQQLDKTTTQPSTTTALNVWWFGGTESSEVTNSADESCELVAVRIERPTSNSRRIFGEIVVDAPIDDVWAILTDYDRLSIHVPNLVESRITQRTSGGEQGDGNFRCRLFQRGAQKIVGFEFGASVTMDMKEMSRDVPFALPAADAPNAGLSDKVRKIEFKCTDSFFFNAFDGEWKVEEQFGEGGKVESLLSYVVDVKPKGPVPVAALEWRIREDVPTNLRAVKKAALEVGYDGVLASRTPRRLAPASSTNNPLLDPATSMTSRNGRSTPQQRQSNPQTKARNGTTPRRPNSEVHKAIGAQRSGKAMPTTAAGDKPVRKMERVFVQWETWEESETMAAYLEEN